MYVKDVWSPKPLPDLQQKYVSDGLEIVLVRITLGKPAKRIALLAVYRPPNSNRSWFTRFDELLLEIISSEGSVIVMGDLNADLLKPNDGSAALLLKSLELVGLKPHGTQPTRVSASTATCLDIISFPAEMEVIKYSAIHSGASDHFPVQAILKAQTSTKPVPVKKRSFKRVDMTELKSYVAGINLDRSGLSDPNELLECWQSSVVSILDQVAPIKNYPVCRKSCKWMTADIRKLIQDRNTIARKIEKSDQNTKAETINR